MAHGPFLRKYGVEATLNFQLFETDGVDFKTDAAHAAGDTTIMKDEGAEANTTNGFVDEGQGYSLVLAAAEMQAARIVVYVVDAAAKVWLDTAIVVETYGHANAMHAFDLDTATQSVDVTLIEGSDATDQVNAACDAALADYDAPTRAEMDDALSEVKGGGWSAASDTLEAIRDAVANVPAQRQTQEI